MKKLHLLLVGLIFSVGSIAQKSDPVVLTIEGEDIYASEFLYIYSKNNDDPSFKKDSLDEYMELFINYKLKVKEARMQKYDTIPALISELAQYRKQLSLPYMTDKEKNEKLIKEAYERTKTEVKASHILIGLKPNSSPEDTIAAYSKIMALRSRINGGENFEAVAKGKGGSEDPSVAVNGGDLGYFSALQMVYPFEDAAFSTPVGTVSMPVRTRFGYHLIWVSDKRPATGMIETAHILVLADEKASKSELEKAEKRIKEIYDLLEAGQKFEDLANKYSDDKSSKSKGGLLPLFGSGAKQRMVPAFEEAAFALKNDGDFSKPIRTMFGYHIIKRIQVIPIASYDDMHRELKLRVERDMRAETTRESFVDNLKKEYNFTSSLQKSMPLIVSQLTDDIFLGKWKGIENDAHDDDVLFAFKDNAYTFKDFETFIVSHQTKMRRVMKEKYIQDQFDLMSKEAILSYEDTQLESKYPEFKSLIQEYRDGILVFEIMQDEIWKKASKDTVGIKNYYNSHKADFTYPVRYDGDLYTCQDKETAMTVTSLIKSGKYTKDEIIHTVTKDSELTAKVKSQLFNSKTTEAFKVRKPLKNIDKVTDKTNVKALAKYKKKLAKAAAKHAKFKYKTFNNGLNKPYKNNGLYYVFNVKETLPAREREFSEAKGLVTAAYQNQLEKQWLKSLRKKYSIKINQETLYNLGNK